MSKPNLGSLADLARILEEAANPDSELREDRRETRPAPAPAPSKKAAAKPVDPKRKAWHDRRLREQTVAPEAPAPESAPKVPPVPTALPREIIARGAPDLKDLLSSATNAKPKSEGGKRPEAWRRKPGDPIF